MITLFIRIIIITLFLSGCSKGLFSIHKIDIQQGNSLDAADETRVQIGMDKKTVFETLGPPILGTVFSKDRWEYVYYLKKPDQAPIERKFAVLFKDDRVTEIH